MVDVEIRAVAHRGLGGVEEVEEAVTEFGPAAFNVAAGVSKGGRIAAAGRWVGDANSDAFGVLWHGARGERRQVWRKRLEGIALG